MRPGKLANVFVVCVLWACSGDKSSPSASDVSVSVEQPLAKCPQTVAAMNGHACASEAMHCTVPVPCTTTNQQVRCDCENSVFSCADSIGPLPPHEEPRCKEGPATDGAMCPAAFDTADGAPCAEVGRSCAYPGAECPGLPVRLTDYCQCKRDPADGTLTLVCKASACPPQ